MTDFQKEMASDIKKLASTLIIIIIVGTGLMILVEIFSVDKSDHEAEKLQLEIQHLKYQVGIDSLRYDMELNFYEKRHAGGE